MKEYLPLLVTLATTPACNAGSISLEDTSKPADIQVGSDTAAEANVVSANQDGQDLGCLSLATDVNAQLQIVVAMNYGYTEEEGWTDNIAAVGEAGFTDRSGTLSVDGEEVDTAEQPDTAGTLRFLEMTADLETGTHDLCIVGNPGETTGEFKYMVLQDGIVADTDVGSSQTFPLAFTPFTVQ